MLAVEKVGVRFSISNRFAAKLVELVEEDEPSIVQTAIDARATGSEFERLVELCREAKGEGVRRRSNDEGSVTISASHGAKMVVAGMTSRDEALSDALRPACARRAAQLSEVQAFRRRFLQRGWLEDHEVDSLLQSPASAWLPSDAFEVIPIIHKAQIVPCAQAGADSRTVRLYVDPPGRIIDPITWPHNTVSSIVLLIRGWEDPKTIEYGFGSLIHELVTLADTLCDLFPWHFGDAIHFLACDIDPNVYLVDVKWLKTGGFVAVDVPVETESWTRAEVRIRADINADYRSVCNGFLAAQRQLLNGRNNAPSPETIDAFGYSEEWQRKNPGDTPKWRELGAMWKDQTQVWETAKPRKNMRKTDDLDAFGERVSDCRTRFFEFEYPKSTPKPRKKGTAQDGIPDSN